MKLLKKESFRNEKNMLFEIFANLIAQKVLKKFKNKLEEIKP